jgi:putative methionine-R-sulfoxide reductase with GAF domain
MSMDSHSIFNPQVDSAPPLLFDPQPKSQPLPDLEGPSLRAARETGETVAEMAQRDLEAALQLLAERARYITGASGAAIALRDDGEMICRASAGPSAPGLGAELQLNSGLTGESVRTRQVLRCDDAESDPRVNRESCRALGIKSVMVTPLVRDEKVIGVFELLADRGYAFEERDVVALERLSEMVLTALDHAEAGHHAVDEIISKPEPAVPEEKHIISVITEIPENKTADTTAILTTPVQESSPEPEPSPEKPERELVPPPKFATCESCGFPVSEGRTLCLDCEEARSAGNAVALTGESPAFLADFSTRQETWWQAHMYTIGTIVMIALTMALLVIKFH